MFWRHKKEKEIDHRKVLQDLYDCYLNIEEKYRGDRPMLNIISQCFRLGRTFGRLQIQEQYGNMIIRSYNEK